MTTILISTDMEGLTGICRWSQVTPTAAEYPQGCEALRRDLREVIDALAGAGHDLVVVDGHWTGTNIGPADVAPARLTSGTRMPWGMAEGIQHADVVGLILLGYHGAAGTAGAMAHTWDTCFTEVRVNGSLAGEITLASMLARQCGVPIIGLSGDDTACAEVKVIGHSIPVAEVKRSISYESVLFHPEAADQIRAMAQQAALRTGRFQASTERHEITAGFLNHGAVDRAAIMPGSERIGPHGLKFSGSGKQCFDALRTWSMLAEH